MAVPFDLGSLEATGFAAPVLENVFHTRGFSRAAFDFSQDGTLVYLPGSTADPATLVSVERDGREIGAFVEVALENPRGIRLSPDGRRVVLVSGQGSGAGDLWVYDRDGRPPTRLTFDGSNMRPVWILVDCNN